VKIKRHRLRFEKQLIKLGYIRRGELNMKRRLTKIKFALLFLAMLAFTASLTSAEVITYDYDDAGQVKTVIYLNASAMA
jgi:hypothetical protein